MKVFAVDGEISCQPLFSWVKIAYYGKLQFLRNL